MTPSETTAILRRMRAAYPRQVIKPETLQVYCEMLVDLDYSATQAAVSEHVATSPHFPTISDIRVAVVKTALGLPDADEAYASVHDQIRSRGEQRGYDARDLHPLAVEALKSVGWGSLCRSTKPGVERAAFVKAYEAACARACRAENLKPLAEAHKILATREAAGLLGD